MRIDLCAAQRAALKAAEAAWTLLSERLSEAERRQIEEQDATGKVS